MFVTLGWLHLKNRIPSSFLAVTSQQLVASIATEAANFLFGLQDADWSHRSLKICSDGVCECVYHSF